MNIEIRKPEPDEFELWLPLWHSYLEFYETILPEGVTQQTWLRFQNPDEPIFLLAAFEQGKMLGFASFLFHRSTWAMTHYCYLEDLFVAESARGNSVGKRLILAVKQEAEARKAERLYWQTREGNQTARALYERLATLTDFVQFQVKLGVEPHSIPFRC